MKVEEKKNRKEGAKEEEGSRNYATTPSLSLPLTLWAEMMYGCKGHMLAV